MHYLAFDKNWFGKHQSKLIWLLNHKLAKRLFRWILCIENEETINRIEPNAYWFGAKKKGKQIEVKADFRTHWKYSKRLYFAFSPIWWTMHFLDWLFIDKYIPKLSFGFLTLTANPAAGDVSPVDGVIYRHAVDETWATIQSSTGTLTDTTSTDNVFCAIAGSTTSNQFKLLMRSIFLFDTSALTAGVSISAAVLSLKGNDKADNLVATPTIDIYTATPAVTDTLATGDFTQIGTTSQTGSPITYASFSIVAYNDFSFNATGIGNISKTGISKFGARNANYDVANSAPPWVSNQTSRMSGYYADQAGTTSDPKLVVTYTIAANTHFLSLLGVGS